MPLVKGFNAHTDAPAQYESFGQKSPMTIILKIIVAHINQTLVVKLTEAK
jgi:hypothetical protein